jgi:hypothetical protein
VSQYDLDGTLINKYLSVEEAVEETGASYSSIMLCCHGKKRSTKDFIFKFSDDKLDEVDEEIFMIDDYDDDELPFFDDDNY